LIDVTLLDDLVLSVQLDVAEPRDETFLTLQLKDSDRVVENRIV
jgi:hypothetical protein